eukprot:gnl/MRDRNA2_/MRDRNA2_74144_c0_seq2.p1 gnl/MRDRNA2_/MRDRNA2_74144_c0~~gnl/MRDRNA2_/MRDRNA2_74144_c0_seq2.p1  ORF type:complete len:226 (-),score=29.02 gnl/MRDRNA2_/MRDRNA2_74144_c0_seq2:510-1187(-)
MLGPVVGDFLVLCAEHADMKDVLQGAVGSADAEDAFAMGICGAGSEEACLGMKSMGEASVAPASQPEPVGISAKSDRKAIVILTRGYEDIRQYSMLISRNKGIQANLSDKSIKLVIFHEGNIRPEQQKFIQSQTPCLVLKFQDVSGSSFCRDRENVPIYPPTKDFGWSYRHMCSFWFVDFWKYTHEYDFRFRRHWANKSVRSARGLSRSRACSSMITLFALMKIA